MNGQGGEYPSCSGLRLIISRDCGINCFGCLLKQSSGTMPDEIYERCLKLLVNSPQDSIALEFAACSSMDDFDRFRDLVERGWKETSARGKQLMIQAYSNGLNLDDKKLDYIRQYGICLMFHFFHTEWRKIKSYYSPITAALKEVSKRKIEHCAVLGVGNNDIGELAANVDALLDAGVRRIWFGYRADIIWKPEDAARYLCEIEKVVKSEKFMMSRVQIANAYFREEPIVVDSKLTVDEKGDIFVGESAFFDTIIEKARDANRLGNVLKLNALHKLSGAVTREKQLKKTLEAYKKGTQHHEIISGFVELGRRMESFFKKCA